MNSKIILSVLIIASAFLHLERIAVPSQPVFDEMYYTTHASRYAQGEPHFDTHPPLGKLLYAIPLFFLKGERTTDAAFIETVYDKAENKIKPKVHFEPYRNFPYVQLRLISAAFGILLPLIVYFFIRAVTASSSSQVLPRKIWEDEVAALLGAFFITFENALLLESRLILLNPMFLAFGLASLIAMFRAKQKPLIGGILFGLAMSVKWTATVFIGPLLFAVILEKDSARRKMFSQNTLKFIAIAILVFLIIQIGIQNLIVPAGERAALYESLIPWLAPSSEHGSIFLAAKAFLVEIIVMVTGYTSGIAWDPELSSKWFLWPFMGTPMTYSRNPLIILVGNPFVWFAGTAAAVMMIWKVFRTLGRPMSQILTSMLRTSDVLILKNVDITKYKPHILLFGSYLFALLPFMLVNRATFLYHYFPALIFSVCLAALLFRDAIRVLTSETQGHPMSQILRRNVWTSDVSPLTKSKTSRAWSIGMIVLLTLAGFILAVPYTYGLN